MTPTQQSTIIAVFPDDSTAQAAAGDLLSIGVSRENMYLESGRAERTTTSGTKTTSQSNEGLGTSMPEHQGGVGGWFKSLFGGEDEATGRQYQEAVRRGNVVLSVHAREDQHERIAEVLERHRPIDIGDNTEGTGKRNTGTAAANTGTAIPVVEEELQPDLSPRP